MAKAEIAFNIMEVLSEYLLSAGATIKAGLTLADLKALFTRDGISTVMRENAYQQMVQRIGYEGVGQMVSELWVYLDEEEQDFYRAKGLGVIGSASAESVLGSVANSLGLTLGAELPREKITEVLRNAGVAEGDRELIAVSNTGTAETPVYKTAIPSETLQRYFKAMWDAGFFGAGGISTTVPSATGDFPISFTLPVTADNLIALMGRLIEGLRPWWNETIKENLKQLAQLATIIEAGVNVVTIRLNSIGADFGDFNFLFYKMSLPQSFLISSVGGDYAVLGNRAMATEGQAFLQLRFRTAGNINVMNYTPYTYYAASNFNTAVIGSRQVLETWGTGSYNTMLTSNLATIALPGIEGVLIQDGATIPTARDIDLGVLYPAWASTWGKYSTLTEEGVITDADMVTMVIDPTDEWEKDRAQAGAQAGVIDTAIEGVIEDIVDKVIVPALDIPKTEVFNPAIAIDVPLEVVIPAGETPPILVPLDDGSAGLFKVYNPSRSQLNTISAYLWQSTIVAQIKQIFQSAYDAVVSLHEVYVQPATSGADYIRYGGLYFSEDTATGTVPLVSNRYTAFTYPAVDVYGLFANSLDYAPYVSMSLYLPFIGIVQLNVNDVMDGQIEVSYIVDVVTGCCVAHVYVLKFGDKQLLYSFEGNCSIQLPVTGREHVLKSELGLLGTMVAGASALSGGGALAGLTAVQGLTSAGGVPVVHKGNTSANAGAVSPRLPYLIINHSESAVAEGYYAIEGGSASETVKLGDCKGYTKVRAVHLDGIACTTTEKQEIEALLMGGVIL